MIGQIVLVAIGRQMILLLLQPLYPYFNYVQVSYIFDIILTSLRVRDVKAIDYPDDR